MSSIAHPAANAFPMLDGDAYAALGDTEQALAAWETAWQEGLRTPIVLNRLAVAYEAQGDYARAVAVLDTLLADQPDNAVGHYRRGLLLLLLALLFVHLFVLG